MPVTDERMAVTTGIFIVLYLLFLVIGTAIMVGWFFVRKFMRREQKQPRSSANAMPARPHSDD